MKAFQGVLQSMDVFQGVDQCQMVVCPDVSVCQGIDSERLTASRYQNVNRFQSVNACQGVALRLEVGGCTFVCRSVSMNHHVGLHEGVSVSQGVG